MSEKKTGLKTFAFLSVILSPPEARRRIYRFFSRPAKKRDSLRMTKIKLRRILFYLLLFPLGCYPAARLKPPPEELTPERVLERAISNQELITTSASLINFNFKSSQESFSGDLELFFKKPDSFAFRVKAFLGPDFISGVTNDDSLLLFFPRTKQYYKGKNLSCSKEVFSQTEFDLFCLLKVLVSETRINKEKAYYTGADQKSYIYQDSVEIWKRSFWVDQMGAFLRKSIWERLNSSGTKYDKIRGFVIEYKDFEKFNGTNLPLVVEMKSRDGKEKLKLKFLERKINKPIPEKKFQIKIPEDAKPAEIDGPG